MLELPPNLSSQDLSTEPGLQAYLADTPFKANSVIRISGGYSNYTFRATLSTLHEDSESGMVASSVIVKHAREYAATAADVPLSIDRMDVEIAALRTIPAFPFFQNHNMSPTVQLAHVLAYDKTNHITILRDFGALPSLRDYILTSTSSPDSTVKATAMAKIIGANLGNFLAQMHIWGYHLLHPNQESQGDVDVSLLDPFRNNAATTAAKQLCAWRTAGRLTEIASRYQDLKGECNWDALSERLQAEVIDREETFTMGDFWTGNILVKTSPSGDQVEQLVVLDWELAKLGISAADIGQFAAEALLLQHYAASPEPGSALIVSFMEAYEGVLRAQNSSSKDVYAALFDARAIAACTAAHQAVWGTLGPWNVRPEVKERNVTGALRVCVESTRIGQFQGLGASELVKRLSS